MCLYVTHLEPEIADKDIICYKLVKRTKIKGVYKSSFQRFEYIIRKLYTNNINGTYIWCFFFFFFNGNTCNRNIISVFWKSF